MEPNTQYFQMLAGDAAARYILQMTIAEEIKSAQSKPYIRCAGETFYLGDGDRPAGGKNRTGIFRRMLRRIRNRR